MFTPYNNVIATKMIIEIYFHDFKLVKFFNLCSLSFIILIVVNKMIDNNKTMLTNKIYRLLFILPYLHIEANSCPKIQYPIMKIGFVNNEISILFTFPLNM